MKIGSNFPGFDISAKGMSVQRKKMNLISENIANANIRDAETNQPYRRKTLEVKQSQGLFSQSGTAQFQTIPLYTSNENHMTGAVNAPFSVEQGSGTTLQTQKEIEDMSPGDKVYMPENPNADNQGYVQLSNVNVITEMTDMIVATRSYEANLTAFNSSKQIAKDTLEI